MRPSNYIILLTILFSACDQMAFKPEEKSEFFSELSYITVISPKGGESWEVGSIDTISWLSGNISSNQVRIDLYKWDGLIDTIAIVSKGSPSEFISSTMQPNSIYKGIYAWQISPSGFSLTDTSNYKIRVTEYVEDVNNEVNVSSGDCDSCNNTTYDDAGIEVCCDSFVSTPNFGYTCQQLQTEFLMDCSGCNCMDSSSESPVYGESINPFTIKYKPLFLLSPNGSEEWELGSDQTITWSSSNVTGNVKIELYSGSTFYKTIVSYTSNDGSHPWSIPSTYSEGSSYRIKISSVNDDSIADYSDNYFSLSSQSSPAITVTSPNGGEDWEPGSSHTITWSSANLSSSNVTIKLYKSGSYNSLLSSYTANNGNYTWTISSSLSESDYYKIRIEEYGNSSVYDESDSYFTIEEPSTSNNLAITVGGGTYCSETSWSWNGCSGSDCSSWNCSQTGTATLNLYDSYGDGWDGNNWLGCVGDDCVSCTFTTGSSCNKSITVSSSGISYGSGTCSCSDEFGGSGDGDGGGSSITVTSPNGGESWEMGQTYTITWTGGFSNTGIDLMQNGSKVLSIHGDVYTATSYSWTIPTSLNDGSNYKMRVYDAGPGDDYDESDSYFTLDANNSDPCVGISCSNYCSGNYAYNNGSCSNGNCSYSSQYCSAGCSNGSCNSDPCDGVNCSNYCSGNYAYNNGSCSNGSCSYSSQYCSYGCSNGSCDSNPCSGVNCSSYCSGNTAYYNGSCSNGNCSYSSQYCSAGCSNGSCNSETSSADCSNAYYCSDCYGCSSSCCPNFCSGNYYYYNRSCSGGFCAGSTSQYCSNGCSSSGCN